MTDKPKAIPELAKHHARPPHHLGKVNAHFDGDTLTIEVNSAAGEKAKEAKDSFERRWEPNLIDDAERRMKEILAAADLPTEAGVVTPTDRYGGGVRGLDELAKRSGHAIGSKVWYAAKIIEDIADLRDARKQKDHDLREHLAFHLGALMREAMIVVDYPNAFDLGLQMMAGRSRPRHDVLALFIDDALAKLGPNASAEDVLNHIRETGTFEIDTDRSIAWTNARSVPKTTSWRAFENRLSKRRNVARKSRQ